MNIYSTFTPHIYRNFDSWFKNSLFLWWNTNPNHDSNRSITKQLLTQLYTSIQWKRRFVVWEQEYQNKFAVNEERLGLILHKITFMYLGVWGLTTLWYGSTALAIYSLFLGRSFRLLTESCENLCRGFTYLLYSLLIFSFTDLYIGQLIPYIMKYCRHI